MYWVIFVYFSPKYCLKHRSSRFNIILKADVYQIIQSNWFCVHIIVQGVRGCVKIKSMNLIKIQREVTFAPHIWPYTCHNTHNMQKLQRNSTYCTVSLGLNLPMTRFRFTLISELYSRESEGCANRKVDFKLRLTPGSIELGSNHTCATGQ